MANFLILFEDEVTSCLLVGAIQQMVPGTSVLRAANTYQAMQVLLDFAKAGEQAENEVIEEARILLDMDMSFLEAYVFLNELRQTKFPFPLKVYLFGYPDEMKEFRPNISSYQGMKWMKEESVSTTVEKIVHDQSTDYFQHDKRAKFPFYF